MMKYVTWWYITQALVIASLTLFSIYWFILIVQEAFVVSEMHIRLNASLPQNNVFVQPSTDDETSSLNGPRLEFQEDGHIRTNILFLKTHKTGSSTMQNILLRFGLRNYLCTMLPSIGNYLGYVRPLTSNSISELLMPVDRKFNIFACHSRYHRNIMNFMHNDTIRITLLRYPPKSFESLYSFYGLDKRFNMTFEQLLLSLPNTSVNFNRGHAQIKSTNQLCYDLGLIVDGKTNDSIIQNFIRYVDEEFDFVMITEYFDECLVLLADLMNWPLDYVAYIRLLARPKSEKFNLTPEHKGKLRDLNKCDSLLYDYFLKQLRQRIFQYGVYRLMENLRRLHRMNEDFYSKCVQGETMRGFWGTVSYALKPTADWECIHSTKNELQFIDEIREKQIKRFADEKKLIDLMQ